MKVVFFTDNSVDDAPLPFDFLHAISPKIKARFYGLLEHLNNHDGKDTQGIAFRKLHSYPMEEIRIKESKNLHRLILQIRVKDCIYVLHGFTKKEGEKTPQRELEIAYQRLLKTFTNN